MTTIQNSPSLPGTPGHEARRSKPRFDRGARLTLIFVVGLLIYSTVVLAYRLTLPNDGWLSTEPEDFNSYGFVYSQNILGLESGLQVGDLLITVEGRSLDKSGIIDAYLFALQTAWQAGSTVNYTVLRQGTELELQVPLSHWRWSDLIGNELIPLSNVIGFISAALLLVPGFVTFLKRPDIPAARALFVLGAVWTSTFLVIGFVPQTIYDIIFPFSGISLTILILASFTVLIPPAFIRFGLVFPHPKPILARHPWVGYLPYLIGACVIVAFFFGYFVLGYVWTAASILIAIVLLVHNALTMRDPISRAQLRWALGGILLGLGMLLLGTYGPIFVAFLNPFANILNFLGTLGFAMMGVTLAIAILRYRLFDIDIIIRKTLVYGILTALLGLIYFGMVTLLQTILSSVTGPQSTVAIVISTLVIAALFGRLRLRIQDTIDRRFYRRKYDAEKALAEFALTAREEVDLESLSRALLEVVDETMQPDSVSIWLRG